MEMGGPLKTGLDHGSRLTAHEEAMTSFPIDAYIHTPAQIERSKHSFLSFFLSFFFASVSEPPSIFLDPPHHSVTVTFWKRERERERVNESNVAKIG